ncbi:carboxy-cis,cis-muconate cyclase [Pseudohyphozyma bogoriensis]|nr:carboxy-cis,cis-muconate cyclase [Pseudohyphozyma bogoriensis]
MAKPFILYAGGYQGRLVTLAFTPPSDDAPASLEVVAETNEAGEAPTWLVIHPKGTHLYAVNRKGTLTTFSIHPTTSLLSPALHAPISPGADGPIHAAIASPSPSSSSPQLSLITAAFEGRRVTSTPILPSGILSPARPEDAIVEYAEDDARPGPHERQTGVFLHEAHVDPSGKWVLVSDMGTDEIRFLEVLQGGRLRRAGGVRTKAGDGPRHLVFDAVEEEDGKRRTLVYSLNEISNSVSIYAFVAPSSTASSSSPTLTHLQTLSTLPPTPHSYQTTFHTWHAAAVKLSPPSPDPSHRRYLYASNRADEHNPGHNDPNGPEDIMAIYQLDKNGLAVDPENPTFTEVGGRAPRHFSLSSEGGGGGEKEGRWVAVALHDSDEVVVLERDLEGGGLREVARKKGVGMPAVVLWR